MFSPIFFHEFFSEFEQLKKKTNFLQLNEYKAAPYFLQLSQNMTSYCFLISEFYLFCLPEFTCHKRTIVPTIKTKQF